MLGCHIEQSALGSFILGCPFLLFGYLLSRSGSQGSTLSHFDRLGHFLMRIVVTDSEADAALMKRAGTCCRVDLYAGLSPRCIATEQILWLNGVAHVIEDVAQIALVLVTLVDGGEHRRNVALKTASLPDVIVKEFSIRVDICLPRFDIERAALKVLQS